MWDYYYNTPQGKSWAQVDADFMAAHPGVTVNHVGIPSDSYPQTYKSAFATKTGPDVIFMVLGDLAAYKSQLEPLNSYITPDLTAQLRGWQWMNGGSGTTIYGLPYNLSAASMYYNVNLFAQVGLQPPTNLDQLLNACKVFNAHGIIPFANGSAGGAGWGNNWITGVIWPGVATVADAVGLANGTAKWTDPPATRASQVLLQLVNAGCFAKDYLTISPTVEGATRWTDGKAAMFAHFPGYIPPLTTGTYGVFQFAVDGPTPNFVSVQPVVGWSVTSWSQNKAAAFAYIENMVGAAAQTQHFKIDGIMPTNVNSDISSAAPDTKAILSLPADTVGVNWSAMMQPAAGSEYGIDMGKVIAGQMTLTQALQDTQSKEVVGP